MTVIYKIQSKMFPERFYVGSAIKFKERKTNHLKELTKGIHGNRFLQNHANKYGITDLSFDIIEIVTSKNTLIEREQYFLDTLNPTFNICRIAGSQLNTKRTEESRKKMSLAQKDKKSWKLADSDKKNISERMIGNKHGTGNQNAKGRKDNEAQLAHKRMVLKGRKMSAEHIEKRTTKRRKPVIKCLESGEVVGEYISISDAGRLCKISAGHICSSIKLEKLFGGYMWKYKQKNNETI